MIYRSPPSTPRVALGVCLLFVTTVLALPRTAPADEPESKDAEKSPPGAVDLVVDPAAEPVPALKYHLLVPAEARIAGNAAPIYSRIAHERNDAWRSKLGKEVSDVLNMSPEEFPLDKAGKLLDEFRTVADQLSAAARRSDCDWEYVVEGQDPITIILSDAQFMRSYARLLALKTRYEARSGDLPAAIGSLRDGLALGKNVADAPIVVNQLIGIAIDGVMLAQFDELIQRPGAPNLYWALAELPRPLISMRDGVATECDILEMKFPELARLDDPDARPDWKRLAKQMRDWAAEIIRSDSGIAGVAEIVQLQAAPTDAQLDDARTYLQERYGQPADQVQAMSPAEVEVRFTLALFHDISDGWRKWFLVPYSQALPDVKSRGNRLFEEAKQREMIPLLSLLTPVHSALLAAPARIDRQVARLQTIEAMRMHAAATGKLPETLADVTVVPVPLDPVTGGPFKYTCEGDTATLDISEGTDVDRQVLRVPTRIRLRSK